MRRVLLSVLAIALIASGAASPSGDELEYQVKAAFLFNFLKFVDWPPDTARRTWVIGVLGRDPFGEMLDQTVQGKVVNGRSISVRRFSRASEVKYCNILFIGRTDYERLGIPAQTGLLTVGEAPGFLKSGGIINFYIDDNRVRFEIKPAAANGIGLRVSSQLLKLGRTL